MTIKIEKGVPIPSARGRTGVSDAIRKMKVGDSIVVVDRMSAGTIAKQVFGKAGHITTRKLPDGTFRVWRIK